MEDTTKIILAYFFALALMEWSNASRRKRFDWLRLFLLTFIFEIEKLFSWIVKALKNKNSFGVIVFLLGWTILLVFGFTAAHLEISWTWLLAATLLAICGSALIMVSGFEIALMNEQT